LVSPPRVAVWKGLRPRALAAVGVATALVALAIVGLAAHARARKPAPEPTATVAAASIPVPSHPAPDPAPVATPAPAPAARETPLGPRSESKPLVAKTHSHANHPPAGTRSVAAEHPANAPAKPADDVYGKRK
jgi:hypothetical protein